MAQAAAVPDGGEEGVARAGAGAATSAAVAGEEEIEKAKDLSLTGLRSTIPLPELVVITGSYIFIRQ